MRSPGCPAVSPQAPPPPPCVAGQRRHLHLADGLVLVGDLHGEYGGVVDVDSLSLRACRRTRLRMQVGRDKAVADGFPATPKSPASGVSRAIADGSRAMSTSSCGGNRAATWRGWLARQRCHRLRCSVPVSRAVEVVRQRPPGTRFGYRCRAALRASSGIAMDERYRQMAALTSATWNSSSIGSVAREIRIRAASAYQPAALNSRARSRAASHSCWRPAGSMIAKSPSAAWSGLATAVLRAMV